MVRILIIALLTVPVFYISSALLNPGQQDGTKESILRGAEVYNTHCVSCHQANGEGLSGVFPPLAKSDHLKKDQSDAIKVLLAGQNEVITVNGVKYNTPMAAYSHLTDEQIADVLNYMGNSWGNRFNIVQPDQVKSKR
jgi:nitrite reductase (NO-forming)